MKILAILGLGLLVAAQFNCSGRANRPGGSAAAQDTDSDDADSGNAIPQTSSPSAENPGALDPSEDPDVVNNPNRKVEALQSSFGLLNFRQLEATFTQATGVKFTDSFTITAAGRTETRTVGQEYLDQLGSLAKDYSPAAISAAKVSSAMKLAASYCDVLSNNTTLLAAKFPSLNLTQPIANSQAFASSLLANLYGPEHALQGNRTSDIAAVAATVDQLKVLPGANSKSVFMAACSAILSSAEFYIY